MFSAFFLLPMNYNYSHSLINSLQNVDTALDSFTQSNGLDLVLNEIRFLFVEYSITQDWGVAILHSHFPLSTNQRLINFGHTTVPVEWEAIKDDAKRSIQPCSWLFDDVGQLRPFEYTYDIRPSPTHTPPTQFISQLNSLLKFHNLSSLVGIVQLNLIPKGFEQTHHNANITIPYEIFNDDMRASDKYSQVVWSFDPISNAKWCQKSCFKGFNHTHDVAHFHWGELRG